MTTNNTIKNILNEDLEASLCSLFGNENYYSGLTDQGFSSLVKELVEADANPNAQCSHYGEFVSHFAVIFQTPLEVIKTLSDLGTVFSLHKDVLGETACDIAKLKELFGECVDDGLYQAREEFLVGNGHCQPADLTEL